MHINQTLPMLSKSLTQPSIPAPTLSSPAIPSNLSVTGLLPRLLPPGDRQPAPTVPCHATRRASRGNHPPPLPRTAATPQTTQWTHPHSYATC